MPGRGAVDRMRTALGQGLAPMSPLGTFWLLCFGSLFSIVDPFAAVPIFLALVGEQPRQEQASIALRASLTCFVVLTAFGVAGSFIFRFYGITIAAFKVAGGILLFAVALDMMRAQPSNTRTTHEERSEAASKEDVWLVPLGLPLLSGPGAIATVMVLAGKANGAEQHVGVLVAIFAVSLLTFLVLRSATFMARALGRTGLNVIGRIMGLILAAVAIQFVLDGVREALPRLGG
jgi:multiple antibiotic resistance protein